MHQVQMQFIPGNDSIWVARLEEHHELHQFETEQEAHIKKEELENVDTEDRRYRVVYL
jgi:hypothetical protein